MRLQVPAGINTVTTRGSLQLSGVSDDLTEAFFQHFSDRHRHLRERGCVRPAASSLSPAHVARTDEAGIGSPTADRGRGQRSHPWAWRGAPPRDRRTSIDNVRCSRAARRQFNTQPALAQRLRTYKASKVFPVAKSLFRHGAAGGGTFKLWFVEKSSEVSYKVDIDSNRDTYRGSFKGWSATEDHHRIWVPRDWAARVLAHGLADLDGMMTLDAHRLMSPEGITLYAATWAAQSRGYSVTTHRGFIAISGGLSFHADSAEHAVAGIRRKVTAAGRPPRQLVSPLDTDIDAFVRRYQRYDVTVNLDDARESGSCEYGIRSWCEAVGLDYEDGEAPLADILTAFQARPQVEVRRAILHAIRRQQAHLRKAA